MTTAPAESAYSAQNASNAQNGSLELSALPNQQSSVPSNDSTQPTSSSEPSHATSPAEFVPSSRMRVLRFDEANEGNQPWIFRKNPQNGGFKYIVLLGSFSGMILFSICLCMSIFTQSFITQFSLSQPMGTLAMAIEYLLFCFVSLVVNRVGSTFGIGKVLFFLLACIWIGMFFPSLAENYATVVAIYGIFDALGSSGAELLSMNVLEDYYIPTDSLGFATGVSLTGVGVGSVAYSYIIDKFLDYGWRNGLRYTSFTMFFFIGISVICIQARCLPTWTSERLAVTAAREVAPSISKKEVLQLYQKPPLIEFGLFLNWRYVILMVAAILGNFFFYAPYCVLISDALHHNLNQTDSTFLLVIIGLANVVWRPLWGFIADKLGGVFVFMCSNWIQFGCAIWWLYCKTKVNYDVMSVFIGIGGAGYIVAVPAAAQECLPISKLQSGIGMLFFLGFLFGSPLAGPMMALDYEHNGNYHKTLIAFCAFAGAAGLMLIALMVLMRIFPKEEELLLPTVYVSKEQYVTQIKYEFATFAQTGAFPTEFPANGSIEDVIAASRQAAKPTSSDPSSQQGAVLTISDDNTSQSSIIDAIAVSPLAVW